MLGENMLCIISTHFETYIYIHLILDIKYRCKIYDTRESRDNMAHIVYRIPRMHVGHLLTFCQVCIVSLRPAHHHHRTGFWLFSFFFSFLFFLYFFFFF
jgi:hypothetical protein